MNTRQQIEDLADALGGVPVLGCLPGSTAAQAGVRYGDVILSINGVPTPGVAEYLEGKRLRKDGYDLRVFREGKELNIFVPFGPPVDPSTLVAQLAEMAVAPSEPRAAKGPAN